MPTNILRSISCLICLALSAIASQGPVSSSRLQAADKPNVLIIMADDCTFSDLPLYGGQNARTPNIDALARQGLTFNRAYLTSAMCQPCRAELYTGLYPMNNGCAWNHSASRSGVESLPQILGKADYRVGIAGKVHVAPKSVFPFEPVSGFEPSCVSPVTKPHSLDNAKEFITRDEAEPFCLVVALVEPHVPWTMGDPSQYPVSDLKLPPHLVDNEVTRDAFSRYLAEITYMDGQVGELLQMLDETGRADDTLVLFTSEQGAQFPGCKWTNWDTGVHTAMIARWPGKIAAGERTNALVQYSDVVPTLLAACGEPIGEGRFDGMSFLPVLKGAAQEHRKFVYGMHNNIPEGPSYPIRSITDGEFHYIRNLKPDEIFIEKHLMGMKGDGALNNPYWATWVWDSQKSPEAYRLTKRYMRRPAEQLYRLPSDQYEMENVADRPEFSKIKQRLSDELDRWMEEQGDPGAEQDTLKSHRAAVKGNHRFFPGSTN